MRLACLAVLFPMLASPALADCAPAAAEFERVAPLFSRSVDLVAENAIKWQALPPPTQDTRHAYAVLKVTQIGYANRLKDWIDLAQAASAFALRCKMGDELSDDDREVIIQAVFAGKAMSSAGYDYLQASVAVDPEE